MEPRWVDNASAARRPDRRAPRRAPLRARHRVPRRAHLLAAAGTDPGRVAGRDRADRSVRGRHDAARRDPRGPGLHGRARSRTRPRDPRARVRRRADEVLRHAGRGRVHRDGHAVARVAGRAAARREAHQGRPPHRLDPPAAHAPSRACTPRPTSSTCSRCTTCSSTRLEPMGRLEWATDECEERRLRIRTRPEPELAWWRMKGARQLRGRSRGVAQQVGAWRERTAAAISTCRRASSCPTSRSIGIVQPPAAYARRARARSAASTVGSLRDGAAQGAARRGRRRASRSTRRRCALPESDHVDRALAPAVTVIGAWLSQRASELDLDPAVLATRADLTQLLHGAPSRLATGWRADLVGAPIKRLLAGEATIVLRDGGRRVELRDLVTCARCRGSRSGCSCTRRPRPPTTCAPRGGPPTHSRSTASGCGTTSIPLYGDPDAAHFEAYALLAAMAVETSHARHRRARDVQLVPQPRTCSPTWRAPSTI